MVDYNIFTTGDNYHCDVILTGDVPQWAELNFGSCSLVGEREDLLVESMAPGMNIDLNVYDLPPGSEIQRFNKRLKSAGGDKIGSVSLIFKGSEKEHIEREPTIRINHFKIDKSARRKGLGQTLMLVVFGMAEMSDRERLEVWIGGGEDTAEWLKDIGFPPEDIEFNSTGSVSFTTRLSKIRYNRGRIRLIGDE